MNKIDPRYYLINIYVCSTYYKTFIKGMASIKNKDKNIHKNVSQSFH